MSTLPLLRLDSDISSPLRNACVCAGEVRMAQGGSQVAARDQAGCWRGEREKDDVQGNKKDKKRFHG